MDNGYGYDSPDDDGRIEVDVGIPEPDSEDDSLDDLLDPDLEESPTPSEPDEDAQHFDIALAAEHSYMGDGFVRVSGGAVVEAGQCVAAPGMAAPNIVFPGELVPLRLPRAAADKCLQHPDHLLVLLVPDEFGVLLSGYGCLCEVMETSVETGEEGEEEEGDAVCLKARATHRVKLLTRADTPQTLRFYDSPRSVRVSVLPEGGSQCALSAAATHDMLRLLHAHTQTSSSSPRQRALRACVAASTPWPLFVYEAHSLSTLRDKLRKHFHQQNIPPLPAQAVALSAWACANVSLTYKERLCLLKEHSALARLAILLRMLGHKSRMLYCIRCGNALAKRSDEIAMTTAGVHGHYANPGGYTHDVLTVRRGSGLTVAGASSEQYSWFPGYAWRIALCSTCNHHKGWRFDAVSRLVPRRFFALCRNHVTPHPPTSTTTTTPRVPDNQHVHRHVLMRF